MRRSVPKLESDLTPRRHAYSLKHLLCREAICSRLSSLDLKKQGDEFALAVGVCFGEDGF
jgi:hypothetical protein